MDILLELNYELLDLEAKKQAYIEVHKEIYKKEFKKELFCKNKAFNIDAIVDYFIKWVDFSVNKTELRNLKLCKQNDFKQLFEANYNKIVEKLADKGFSLNKKYLRGNTQVFICTKNK